LLALGVLGAAQAQWGVRPAAGTTNRAAAIDKPDPPVPGLRRSHEHHRNLHARLDAAIPTAAAANCDQDRYVVITSPCYRFKIPIVLAGRRSATAALVQICFCDLNMAIDLPGLRQIPAPAADQSCAQSRQPMHSWPAVAITQLRRPQILITTAASHFPLPAVSFIEVSIGLCRTCSA
jgi:hypothetical protein